MTRYGIGRPEGMPRTLLAAVIVVTLSAPAAGEEPWSAAYKRGDYATAAALLQRAVFEPPAGGHASDPAALKQLALLYRDGKGVERDAVLACGLLRAHAAAAAGRPVTPAAKRDAKALVDKYCAPLGAAGRAAASAAMSCPHIGLPRGATVTLEPGWSIRFNDRSATLTRGGETREQALAGDLLCHSQVLLVRHSPIDGSSSRSRAARHVIELVTLQSGWHAGAVTREIVWQLYEVRGLDLDLAAVQRWEQPGSAWPAPPLPGPLARGAAFTVRGSGEIAYEIPDDPPRRGTVAGRRSK
jgi:hypothetical protein